ncbi:MAG: hypothetical protein QW728_00380 [Thermoplasmata archaeon]
MEHGKSRRHLLIVDGSNVSYSAAGPQQPKVKVLRGIIEHLSKRDVRFIVVADATLLHKIDDRSQLDELIQHNYVNLVPAQTSADDFIIELAKIRAKKGDIVQILTNDQFPLKDNIFKRVTVLIIHFENEYEYIFNPSLDTISGSETSLEDYGIEAADNIVENEKSEKKNISENNGIEQLVGKELVAGISQNTTLTCKTPVTDNRINNKAGASEGPIDEKIDAISVISAKSIQRESKETCLKLQSEGVDAREPGQATASSNTLIRDNKKESKNENNIPDIPKTALADALKSIPPSESACAKSNTFQPERTDSINNEVPEQLPSNAQEKKEPYKPNDIDPMLLKAFLDILKVLGASEEERTTLKKIPFSNIIPLLHTKFGGDFTKRFGYTKPKEFAIALERNNIIRLFSSERSAGEFSFAPVWENIEQISLEINSRDYVIKDQTAGDTANTADISTAEDKSVIAEAETELDEAGYEEEVQVRVVSTEEIEADEEKEERTVLAWSEQPEIFNLMQVLKSLEKEGHYPSLKMIKKKKDADFQDEKWDILKTLETAEKRKIVECRDTPAGKCYYPKGKDWKGYDPESKEDIYENITWREFENALSSLLPEEKKNQTRYHLARRIGEVGSERIKGLPQAAREHMVQLYVVKGRLIVTQTAKGARISDPVVYNMSL